MSRQKKSKIKLLVVDDETYNLDLLYRTFRRDFQVFKAESGPGALEILEEQGEMGVIISDQRMPEMNGTEFLSKTVDRFPDTIRILLTGYTDVEDLVDAINSGQVFKYITKPWNPEELKSIVQQASETYRVLKQRTNSLNRTLRREALFNEIMTAIRESLDYSSMLQTIVETAGKSFQASRCFLHPVEGTNLLPTSFSYRADGLEEADAESEENAEDTDLVRSALENGEMQVSTEGKEGAIAALAVPLIHKKQLLALLSLQAGEGGTRWEAEDVKIIESVADQAALALYQARLYQQTQEQAEQMRAELEVARQIQNNLLRQSWPDFEDASVQACCYAARAVGGDFFEVYVHAQGDIWLAVGDVSGKGVPAALFMASAISVMRRELSQETSPEPEDVMKNLNVAMADDLIGNNCFITMVIARYTPSTRCLSFANAGHIYPMIWPHRKVVEQYAQGGTEAVADKPNYLQSRGIPLGILPVWRGKVGSLELQPGDAFLLTSDGITEATIVRGEESGLGFSSGKMLEQEGLWRLLQMQDAPLDLDRLLACVREHTQEQEDDQTMLSLEVL